MTFRGKKIRLSWIAVALSSLIMLLVTEVFAQTATIRFSVSTATANEPGGVGLISVVRSVNTASQVSVDYSTSNGTAQDGLDYNAVFGTLTFLSGETKKTISVPIIDDVLNENNETIIVTLSNPAGGAALGTPNTALLIIVDDDPAPSLSINDVTVTEGNAGTVDAVFTVSLSFQSGKTVFVDYGVGGVTASAGDDFLPSSGTFSFLPGEISKTITVVTNGDVLNEADETYNIVLSSAVNADLVKSIGVGTILNDDPALTISINDVSITEGNGGTTSANFTLTLSAPSGQAITVNYTTVDGSALSTSDYVASTGTVTFFPGEASKNLAIAINGDITFEPDETFAVNLSGPTGGAIISRSKGSGTIVNDDVMPSVSINGVSLAEGNSGTSNAVFTVALSAPSSDVVTVNYATANGTAVTPADYVAASGALTFAPGVTSQTITVLVNGNTIYQADKTFFVNLSGVVNATIGVSQASGTILNDDVCPTITLGPVTLPNGNIGATYNQALSASGGTAPYAFIVSSGTLPAGLTLSGGTLSGTATAAGSFTFTVTATDANGCMGSLSYTLVVNQIPTVSINNIAVTEFNKGTVNAVFTVALSFATPLSVTITYATANGTATAGVDYTASSGTITFAPGTTSQTITVLIKGDRKKETNETFSVTLSNPVNSTIGTGTGTCTIVNDDGLPKIHINSESIAEGNSGTKQMVFTVHISKKWSAPVTVEYTTADGTAQAGSDYVVASGTVTFAPGENKKTIAVTISGDVTYEQDEKFTVILSNPTNGKLDDDDAKGSINNDDQKPKIASNHGITSGDGAGAVFATDEIAVQVPTEFTLSQNYPNPFNPSTTIRYAIAKPTNVKLQIYNALGEVVATLVDREQVEGTYQFQWQPNLPSGVYFYRLVAGGFVETKRMILMK